jgi:flavin-dependent dehydrogenase
LIDQAVSSGSELEEGDPVVDVKVGEDLVECSLSSGKTMKTQLIIDASGVTSIVARKMGMSRGIRTVLLSFEKNLEIDFEKFSQQIDPSILEAYFTPENQGYGWVFPRSKSVSIGFGARADSRFTPYDGFVRFCRLLQTLKKIDFNMEPFNTFAIPAAGDPMEAVANRTILVGDAAGFTDPFSGEGIQYAIKSGKYAAITASNAIDEEDFSRFYLQQDYSRACEEDFAGGLRTALRISSFFHNHIDLLIEILNDGANELWLENAQGKLTYKTFGERFVRGLPLWLIQTSWKRLTERIGFSK